MPIDGRTATAGARMTGDRPKSTRRRGAAHAALVLAGLLSAATPAGAQADSANTYVRVSRRDVRVVFAPETSSTWGWSVAAPGSTHRPSYYWSAIVEGPDGPRTLGLHVGRGDDRARTFPSLESVVRSGSTTLCQPGMVSRCFDARVEAGVEGRRVVLTYRDSAAVSRMFAMRPDSVRTLTEAPGMRGLPALGGAAVRYVDADPTALTAALRTEAARARRAYEASVNRVSRAIGGGSSSQLVWLAVGDSAQLGIEEWHCLEDVCGPYHGSRNAPRNWGRWSVGDSLVARLHRLNSRLENWRFHADSERVMTIVALRPGRTQVRAAGVHTAADSVPSRTRLDSILTREVLVTPAVARLVIAPRPATMIAGDSTAVFTVRVSDRAGRAIEGTPVELKWGGKGSYWASLAMEPVRVAFPQPGRFEIVATLGAYADTVNVDVVAPRR